jgi:hypothetical protein
LNPFISNSIQIPTIFLSQQQQLGQLHPTKLQIQQQRQLENMGRHYFFVDDDKIHLVFDHNDNYDNYVMVQPSNLMQNPA